MPLDKAALIAKVNAYITTNLTKDITAAKTREILIDIINAFDGSSLLTDTINLSDPVIYNANTRALTIPTANVYTGIITLSVDAWLVGTTYAQYALVRSQGGADGGTAGLCYRSMVASNVGNLLSDVAKWEFADVANGNVGTVEILSISNVATDHNYQFEAAGIIYVKFIATPLISIAPNQIGLDVNTDLVVTGYAFIILRYKSSIMRKTGGGLLQ